RHHATAFLDNTVLLAPDPDWVRKLPNGKLPDRTDFSTYGQDLGSRVKVWQQAVSEAQRLADELAEWLLQPDFGRVEAL
ncbi:MAG: phospholipase, partial [Betaproteobacteria bacterium]|nr:phospholipase [Betaproteobacteria bacterium]